MILQLVNSLLSVCFGRCGLVQFESFLWVMKGNDRWEKCKDNAFYQFLHCCDQALDIQWVLLTIGMMGLFQCAYVNILFDTLHLWFKKLLTILCDFINCLTIISLDFEMLHNNILGVIEKM